MYSSHVFHDITIVHKILMSSFFRKIYKRKSSIGFYSYRGLWRKNAGQENKENYPAMGCLYYAGTGAAGFSAGFSFSI
jgi:hypothetical protein